MINTKNLKKYFSFVLITSVLWTSYASSVESIVKLKINDSPHLSLDGDITYEYTEDDNNYRRIMVKSNEPITCNAPTVNNTRVALPPILLEINDINGLPIYISDAQGITSASYSYFDDNLQQYFLFHVETTDNTSCAFGNIIYPSINLDLIFENSFEEEPAILTGDLKVSILNTAGERIFDETIGNSENAISENMLSTSGTNSYIIQVENMGPEAVHIAVKDNYPISTATNGVTGFFDRNWRCSITKANLSIEDCPQSSGVGIVDINQMPILLRVDDVVQITINQKVRVGNENEINVIASAFVVGEHELEASNNPEDLTPFSDTNKNSITVPFKVSNSTLPSPIFSGLDLSYNVNEDSILDISYSVPHDSIVTATTSDTSIILIPSLNITTTGLKINTVGDANTYGVDPAYITLSVRYPNGIATTELVGVNVQPVNDAPVIEGTFIIPAKMPGTNVVIGDFVERLELYSGADNEDQQFEFAISTDILGVEEIFSIGDYPKIEGGKLKYTLNPLYYYGGDALIKLTVTDDGGTDRGGINQAETIFTISALPLTYPINVNVTGLLGDKVVLQNNLGDDLTISADGDDTFSTEIVKGTGYDVKFLTQPTAPNQVCKIISHDGNSVNVSSVSGAINAPVEIDVECTTTQYNVGVTVTGYVIGFGEQPQPEGNELKLQNNLGNDLSITGNGSYTFSESLDDFSDYSVSVSQSPTKPSQICTVTGGNNNNDGTGTLSGGDDLSINVLCVTDSFVVGGIVTGLEDDEVIAIKYGIEGYSQLSQVNGITGDIISFSTSSEVFFDGTPYTVGFFGPQPTGKTCEITGGNSGSDDGSGTINGEHIGFGHTDSILITCHNSANQTNSTFDLSHDNSPAVSLIATIEDVDGVRLPGLIVEFSETQGVIFTDTRDSGTVYDANAKGYCTTNNNGVCYVTATRATQGTPGTYSTTLSIDGISITKGYTIQ